MRIERGPKRLVRPREGRSNKREWVALSSADLVVPSIHMDLVLAYEAAPPTSALEEGLQKALCDYRELAGRIQLVHLEAVGGRPAILLNDAGSAFIEAQADSPLHQLLPFNPSLLLSNHLVPPYLGATELLLVQVTRFSCGGMTLGVAWHHQVADAKATIDFIKGWTLRVQSFPILFCSSQDRSLLMGKECPCPTYDHNEFKWFPPHTKSAQSITSENQEVVVRKLHFNAQFLKTIKEVASIEGEQFTRFESLMGHLWRCITRARGLDNENGGDKEEDEIETKLTIAVNARTRMDPRIEEGYFGNVVCCTCAKSNAKSLTKEPLRCAAKLIKEAIRKVDESFLRSTLDFAELKERQPFEVVFSNWSALSPNLIVSSWANFPLYQLDFGFGSPLFAGVACNPPEGGLFVLPTPLFDGSHDVVISLHALAMNNLLSTYEHIF